MSKPEPLRLADELSKSHLNHHINHAAAAELRRLHEENEGLKRRVETSAQALRQWLDKTQWIQDTAHGSELGLHRADAIRQRLKKTEAQRDALQAENAKLHGWFQAEAQAGGGLQRRLNRAEAQRDALLEALKEMLAVWEDDPAYGAASADKARAAIKAVEGEKA